LQERDGRTGKEQILLERRMGDRARRVEKSRDINTGDEETVDNTVRARVISHYVPILQVRLPSRLFFANFKRF
jgi:hypothetical protein